MRRTVPTLEIDNPRAECGACGFASRLGGAWSVEDGRLAFRADLDPLTRRGPDFGGCSESSHDGLGAVSFLRIEVDGEALTGEQVAELRTAADAAVEF